MKGILIQPTHLAIVICWLALAGCLGGPSAPTNFYMLSPLGSSQARPPVASADDDIRIGLANVVVAEYLNRNEIVINLDDTVYQLAEFNQWAEPLNENLTRVLAENLIDMLRDDSIAVFLSSDSSIPFDYRLEIDVIRFDGNLGTQVSLVAQWALLEAEDDDLTLMRRWQYQETVADDTYKGLVLAKSRAVEKLSRDIAASIKTALGK